MKQKINFVLNNQIYIRNFVKNYTLAKIKKYFNVTLIINQNIDKKCEIKELSSFKKEFYKRSKSDDFLLKYHDIKSTYLNHRSKFFPFRLIRLYRFDLRFLSEILINKELKINLLNKIKYSPKLFLNFFKYLFYKTLSNFLVYNILKILINYLIKNESIDNLVKENKSEIYIIPTSGYDPDTINFIQSLKKYKKKSYLIVDNWDNLSSKIIFDRSPDRIAVWGEQTKMHAKNIQNILPNKINVLGSARAEQLFLKRKKKHKSFYSNNYVLFLGSSWAWDEEKVISEIDNFVFNEKKIFKDLKIIYRPHPFRQRRTFFSANWKVTTIDKQIYNSKIKKFTDRKWPDLKYYPSLIQNSNFVIGGLTSMLLETAIFWKNYLAIAYDDNLSLMNPANALKYFPHLESLEKIPCVKFCKDSKFLFSTFLKTYRESKKISTINKINIDRKRNYFLKDSSKFTENLIFDIIKFNKI